MKEYKVEKVGDRIELVHMDDSLTRLKPGDKGTIYKIDEYEELIWVKWDSGENLALIKGYDKYRIINN